jgi:hypothetical protein
MPRTIAGKKRPHYRCECTCGRQTTASTHNLRRAHTMSCGCLEAETKRTASRTHGQKHHPLYSTWESMRQRCNDPRHPSFRYYGARGIKVCARWDDFAAFLADVGERPDGLTLDRIDNDGDYEPGNCRWATLSEQMASKRPWGTAR